jgi:hypothetical protein
MLSQIPSFETAREVDIVNKPVIQDSAVTGMTTPLLWHNYHLSTTHMIMNQSMISMLLYRSLWTDVHYIIILMIGAPLEGFFQLMVGDIKPVDPPDEVSPFDLTKMKTPVQADTSFAHETFPNAQKDQPYDLLFSDAIVGEHPDLYAHYFCESGSTSRESGSQSSNRRAHSTPRTELSPDLAEDRAYGRDKRLCESIRAGLVDAREDFQNAVAYYTSKVFVTYSPDHEILINAPKPRRRQNIAVDFEKLVERFSVDDSTMADYGAAGATWRQRDDYKQQQQQQQSGHNAPPGLQHQNLQYLYMPEYHSQ